MPSYGHAQILGFSEDVQKAADKERVPLGKNGTDADQLIGKIQTEYDQVAALNAQQEQLKRQLKATTAAYMAARVRLYAVASGALDTVMAAVQKNSAAARNLQRLRSRIRKPRGPTEPVPVPLPVAAPPA